GSRPNSVRPVRQLWGVDNISEGSDRIPGPRGQRRPRDSLEPERGRGTDRGGPPDDPGRTRRTRRTQGSYSPGAVSRGSTEPHLEKVGTRTRRERTRTRILPRLQSDHPGRTVALPTMSRGHRLGVSE